MGSIGSCQCCTQSVVDARGSEADGDGGGAEDGAGRVQRRRGPTRRIGDRPSAPAEGDGAGAACEEHLSAHRRPRSKGAATQRLIKDGMRQDRVCACLGEAELETILHTMAYYEFKEGETVVQQGKTGSTFFVTHQGDLEVVVNGSVQNRMTKGQAFGGIALIYRCPRTATVRAAGGCGVWGANGEICQQVLQENAQRRYAENRKFIDSLHLFDGLTDKQKDRVGEVCFTEVFEADARVMTQGEATTAIYFVKRGELRVCRGGAVGADGRLVGGAEAGLHGPGDCLGERALLESTPLEMTVLANGSCELLCISVGDLKEVLGDDVAACLDRNLILMALRKSVIISQFSATQQQVILGDVEVRSYAAGARVEEPPRFAVVLDGLVSSGKLTLHRGQWLETNLDAGDGGDASQELMGWNLEAADFRSVVAGPAGARLGILTRAGFARALGELGFSSVGALDNPSDAARKMVLIKKVHVFRHLSQPQTAKLMDAFVLQRYLKDAVVIKQGDMGSTFFVVASGEVAVMIDGRMVRTLGKNAYFGERALLFDEPRTATIQVSSKGAELWSVDKETFAQIVRGNMQQTLMHRIQLQDTDMSLKDIRAVKVIGAGAAGVVRLVQHTKTHKKYALKRVHKQRGKVPEDLKRECQLLKENDHPFIMTLVKTFETPKSIYILTELITGGELHHAIRQIPSVLSRAQAQFYTGSLVIVLAELCDRSIVYRDLKPENVMLDEQGYLKLIDFGIAKKLPEGKTRTFTRIGTPHYMAPEVMRGRGYGSEADLWSLGVVLFEFVCGHLPFANDLEDPTEVCTAVLKSPLQFPRRCTDALAQQLMRGLLTRQPKARLGAGLRGYEDVKASPYFQAGHGAGGELFDKIMGRELRPPYVPRGEIYLTEEDAVVTALSDAGEFGR